MGIFGGPDWREQYRDKIADVQEKARKGTLSRNDANLKFLEDKARSIPALARLVDELIRSAN